jgi:hypothetical protein
MLRVNLCAWWRSRRRRATVGRPAAIEAGGKDLPAAAE